MRTLYFLSFIIVISLLPNNAHAYLAPLVGIAGVIIAAIVAGLGAVLYLIYYNFKKARNALSKKRQKNEPKNDVETDSNDSDDVK